MMPADPDMRAEAVEAMARDTARRHQFDPDEVVPMGGDVTLLRWQFYAPDSDSNLTALLAFLAERGCKVVGPHVTDAMTACAMTIPGIRRGTLEEMWRTMLASAPSPLEGDDGR